MELFGYGEDALTLYALQQHLPHILCQLDDSSDESKCRIIYRPSFGRGKGGGFGEFDFIISTPKAIHLGETKWAGSKEFRKRTHAIDLDLRQVRRHKTFETYLQQWAEYCKHRLNHSAASLDWDDFVTSVSTTDAPPILHLPKSDTTLAQNIQLYMSIMEPQSGALIKMIDHVVLFMEVGNQFTQLQVPYPFTFVHVDCSSDTLKNLIRLH